jgi:hypothetical protein
MCDWATRAQADAMVASGDSIYRDSWTKSNGLVSDPNWHTASYLSLEEIRRSLQHHSIDLSSTPLQFHAVIAAMEALERGFGAGRTRIVFWFDN